MASPLQVNAIDKTAQRRANKDKIKQFISCGLEVHEIEEKFQKDGFRITAQLHESIVWEMRFPEVQELLLKGFDVPAIEEKMRLGGWNWTSNLRNKAWWEYHKDEIIDLYTKLRSVESVQVIMTRNGFPPQKRIYYEWLRDWGVPTDINRISLTEWSSTQGSPNGSTRSVTPGSATGSHQHTHEGHDWQPFGASESPLSDTFATGNGTITSTTSAFAVNVVAPNEDTHFPLHPEVGSMDIDETFHPSRFLGPLHSCPVAIDPTISMQNFQELHMSGTSRQPGLYSPARISANGSSFLVHNGRSRCDDGEDSSGSKITSGLYSGKTMPSASSIVVSHPFNQQVQLPLQRNSGQCASQTWEPIFQDNPNIAQPLSGSSISLRHDSAVALGISSTQSSVFETPCLTQHISGLGRDLSEDTTYGNDWTSQNIILQSIRCEKQHQGIGFNFHCCGSSSLQDLAYFAQHLPSQQVHEFLCSHMRQAGVRLYDDAGNSYLHKLAVLGASWKYFEAAFNAFIEPRHLNAYGQSFAHVLNISALHENLMECLNCIRGLGIDFSSRDASGWTILHCLYSQPMTPQTAKDILKFIESPGRYFRLRDVLGRTPCGIFKQSLKRQTSANSRWSSPELQLQSLAIFEDSVEDGVIILGDEDIEWEGDENSSEASRTKLQRQYHKVIEHARDGIVVEAMDGSNAFHAQAGLTICRDAATDLSSIEMFISIGIDANDYDKYGRTPIEAIITQSRDYEHDLTKSEKVAVLIDKGHASVHSRNRHGHTPLYSAAIRGLDRTVEVLLRRNAHVNIRANDKVSLLSAVDKAWQRAFAEYQGSRLASRYYEAQCSRIEACRDLLERYGAVHDPTPAQAMGYRPGSPRVNEWRIFGVL